MYFFNRRPRGFHYTMRFSNERRDLLDDLRRGVSPEVLAQRSLQNDDSHNGTARRRRSTRGLFLAAGVMIVVVLLLLLAAILLLMYQAAKLNKVLPTVCFYDKNAYICN